MRTLRWVAALAACITVCSIPGPAYSVLTHEQIVDLAWEDRLRPMLLLRFSQATPDELKHAHAFAYGGSLVQDMGYYPFGKKYFSDLLHYVRTGDFVTALLQESTDINEYAFALGALAHYSSDNMGHPTVNQVVAIEFPKLKAKYGNEVTYADDPKAHIRTEFGFDMVQVAKNRYTSDRYHDFIGFEIAQPLLERAFLKTTPNFDRRKFLYHLSRANYEREWGKGYRKPSFGVKVLAFFLRAIPKVGWASALAFKVPSTQTEDMYIKSVNRTVDNYQMLLQEQRKGDLKVADTDCDTGRVTSGAEYSLADSTYARLLRDLSKNNFAQLTPELQANMLDFYSNLNAPFHTKKNRKSWLQTQAEIEQLRSWRESQQPDTPAGTKNWRLRPDNNTD